MRKIQITTAVRERQTVEALSRPERLKTQLAYKTVNQAYLWFTDRGRSRVIKH